MRTLKLRGAFDPKRFYKNADTRKLPTHFSIGTVVEAAQDFHSARLTKKEKGGRSRRKSLRTKRLKKRERLGSPRSKTKRKVPEEIRGKATLIATLVVGRSKVVLLEPFVFVIIRTRDICIFSETVRQTTSSHHRHFLSSHLLRCCCLLLTASENGKRRV